MIDWERPCRDRQQRDGRMSGRAVDRRPPPDRGRGSARTADPRWPGGGDREALVFLTTGGEHHRWGAGGGRTASAGH